MTTLRAALDATVRLGCIRMHWGAQRPCDEYDDGRDPCAPCQVRAALAASATDRVTCPACLFGGNAHTNDKGCERERLAASATDERPFRTAEDILAAINDACPLIDPRLSEVDWSAVGRAFDRRHAASATDEPTDA